MKFFKKNFWIILILIVATLLRFLAVKPGYNQYHGDETAIWGSASLMVKNHTLDPGRYDYPATAMLINVFFYKIFFIPVFWFKYYVTNVGQILNGTVKVPLPPAEIKRVFGIYIIGIREINSLFWSRYITAAFGVGTVFLTYLLSKKMFSKKVGLLAATFLAFNYRNVVNSHITLPDIYNAFFLLLALVSYWDLYVKQTRKNYLIAGILGGLAFSVKYQYFAIIPLILIYLIIVFKNKFSFKKLFNPNIIMSGLSVILVFLLTNPYFFLNIEFVLTKMQEEFTKYGMGTNTLNLFPISYLYHIDYGPVLFILVCVGLLFSLLKKPLKSLFLVSVIAPSYYMFIYYSHGGFYVRNFIPTTPLLLIFASIFIWSLVDFVKSKVNKILALFLFAIIFFTSLYIPAKNSILSTYGYTKQWGFETLKPWVQDNLPKDVVIASHPFDKANLGIKNETTAYSPDEAYSLEEHIENGASYLIMNLNWANLPFYFWMNYGLDEIKLLWNKPVDMMKNTFPGLAAEELFRYQIHVVSKPWQSPDHHFVIVKFPEWPNVKMHEIKTFLFNNDSEDWQVYGYYKEQDKQKYSYDSEVGHNGKGSLTLNPGGVRFPTVRISSQPLEIKPGHLYKISAYLKTQKNLKVREREGFIRMDFYGENPDLNSVGIISSVSSRVYGTDNWVEKEMIERAPETAKYLVVSFQSYATAITRIWMDDMVIWESEDKVEDITKNPPYTHDYIDPNYLYPNSHGNL